MAKEFKLSEVLDKVEDIVKKLKKDDDLMEKFRDKPVKTLEKLLGMDLPDEKVRKVAKLIEAKLDDADIDDKLADLADKFDDVGDELKDKLDGFLKKLDRD